VEKTEVNCRNAKEGYAVMDNIRIQRLTVSLKPVSLICCATTGIFAIIIGKVPLLFLTFEPTVNFLFHGFRA
jgi:hypothetical protein